MKHISDEISNVMRNVYVVGETDDYRCKHEMSEMRKMRTSNGAYQIRRQCLTCGTSSEGPFKHSSSPSLDALPKWDDSLAESYWNRIRENRDQAKTERNQSWWRAYNNYLQSDEWHKKRAKVLNRANGTCEGCGDATPVHVHHETYDRVGNEMLFDLRAVCKSCHEIIHGDKQSGV